MSAEIELFLAERWENLKLYSKEEGQIIDRVALLKKVLSTETNPKSERIIDLLKASDETTNGTPFLGRKIKLDVSTAKSLYATLDRMIDRNPLKLKKWEIEGLNGIRLNIYKELGYKL